jgi:excisionase family DNA binding protein
MPETEAKIYSSNLENAFFELVRQAVRAEVQEISKRNGDRLLTIDQVTQTLSVSKDWVYRNENRFPFTRKLGPKMVRFSETGLQKWLKDQGR